MKADVGLDGRLKVRVIRAKPTLRQRLFDWLRSFHSL